MTLSSSHPTAARGPPHMQLSFWGIRMYITSHTLSSSLATVFWGVRICTSLLTPCRPHIQRPLGGFKCTSVLQLSFGGSNAHHFSRPVLLTSTVFGCSTVHQFSLPALLTCNCLLGCSDVHYFVTPALLTCDCLLACSNVHYFSRLPSSHASVLGGGLQCRSLLTPCPPHLLLSFGGFKCTSHLTPYPPHIQHHATVFWLFGCT
mgnify:CR=1 FL=1